MEKKLMKLINFTLTLINGMSTEQMFFLVCIFALIVALSAIQKI